MLPYCLKNKDFPRSALGLVGRQFATVLPMFGHVRWAGDIDLMKGTNGYKGTFRKKEVVKEQGQCLFRNNAGGGISLDFPKGKIGTIPFFAECFEKRQRRNPPRIHLADAATQESPSTSFTGCEAPKLEWLHLGKCLKKER